MQTKRTSIIKTIYYNFHKLGWFREDKSKTQCINEFLAKHSKIKDKKFYELTLKELINLNRQLYGILGVYAKTKKTANIDLDKIITGTKKT